MGFLPVLVFYILFFTVMIGSTITSVTDNFTPISAYKDNSIVIQDKADVFSLQEEQELEKELRAFGKQTGIIPYV